MENINSQNPIVKIEFLIKKLVDFSNENEFDFTLYQSFANENSKTFNRYFASIDNEDDKAKIISDLKTNFYFEVDNIVTKMLSSRSNNGSISDGTTYIAHIIPDTRISSHESNYKQLIELFLNSVEFDIKPQTKAVPDDEQNNKSDEVKNLHNNIFVGNSVEVWEHYKENKQLTASDRTDLRLIFELMKIDKLINENVELKHYKSWLNKFHFENSIYELKKVELNTKPNLQRANDYNEYKKATLK